TSGPRVVRDGRGGRGTAPSADANRGSRQRSTWKRRAWRASHFLVLPWESFWSSSTPRWCRTSRLPEQARGEDMCYTCTSELDRKARGSRTGWPSPLVVVLAAGVLIWPSHAGAGMTFQTVTKPYGDDDLTSTLNPYKAIAVSTIASNPPGQCAWINT